MELSYLKEEDLVLFKQDTSFWLKGKDDHIQMIKKGTVGVVLDNNFGHTFKERSITFLINGKAMKVCLIDNFNRRNTSKDILDKVDNI